VTATLVGSAPILRALYKPSRVTRDMAEAGARHVVLLHFAFDPRVRALTYERRATLHGRFIAAGLIAKRRKRPFDSLAWWEANRP
jgi:hypothetical protein